MRQVEVAILGGGAAGSAAAIALRQAGVSSVCVVERSDFTAQRIGESIPPDANPILARLGVADQMAHGGHLPAFGSHSIWGSGQLGHNDFMTSPHGHGWHLNRRRFDAMLLAQAEAVGAVVLRETICVGVATDRSGDRINQLQLRSGAGREHTLSARWYIDASGRTAQLLRAIEVPRTITDRQIAIWARFAVAPDSAFGQSTWLEAAPFGWWYAARVPGGQAIVALGTDPQIARGMGVTQLPGWAVALTGSDLIAPALEKARLVPESFALTACQSHSAARAAGANWLAVGDAAAAFDPLSSAGITKALINGRAAAAALTQDDPRAALAAYAAESARDYDRYLVQRLAMYQSEQRWPEALYWAARHRPTTADRAGSNPRHDPVLSG